MPVSKASFQCRSPHQPAVDVVALECGHIQCWYPDTFAPLSCLPAVLSLPCVPPLCLLSLRVPPLFPELSQPSVHCVAHSLRCGLSPHCCPGGSPHWLSLYRGPSHRGILAVPPLATLAVALSCHHDPVCRHGRLVYLAILIVARLGGPRLAAV